MSPDSFCQRGKGKVIPSRGTGTSSGESGARNLEAESVRSSVESMGGCVILKTATAIKWSSAYDTFIAKSVTLSCTEFFVGLGASGEIETEE